MVLIPIKEEENLKKELLSLEKELLGKAIEEVGSKEDTITRDLRPQDLNFEKPEYKFELKEGWNTISDGTIETTRFIGIIGFIIPKDCSITQVEIIRGSSTVRYYTIDGLEGMYYVTDPCTISQNQTLTIDVYSNAKKTQKLGFFGVVTERRGIVVNS